MKLITKKLWVFVAMLCTLISASAYDFEVDGIYYNISSEANKEVSVTFKEKYRASYSGVVNIPASVSYNGDTYSVTTIGDYAFEDCSNLHSVTIPNSVTTIKELAFYKCTNMCSITIGSGVEKIGKGAFSYKYEYIRDEDYTKYYAYTIPKVIWLCNTCPIGDKEVKASVNYVSNNEFGLTNQVVYPLLSSRFEVASIVYVPLSQSEFACDIIDCNYTIGLSRITIPEIVTYNDKKYKTNRICDYAFYGFTNLCSLTIATGVKAIGYNAFSYKKTAEGSSYTYTIPKVIWLGNTCPNGYKEVKASVNYVSNNEFRLSNQKVYPFLSSRFEVDNVVYIPVSPSERTCDVIDCNYAPSSTEIVIDSIVNNRNIQLKVLNVNPYSFYKNPKITSLKISNSGNIGENAFYSCDALETVVAGNNGSIGKGAFYECKSLKTADLSNKGYVGEEAFYNCDALESVTASNIGYIGEKAFYDCDALKSVVASNSGYIGRSAFNNCKNLKTADISNKGNVGYAAFYNCSSLETATLNIDSIIGESCFENCANLSSVKIGAQVTKIYSSAFKNNTSLPEIIIPDNITSLGSSTFSGCSSLTNVTIGKGINTLPISLFSGCKSLASIVIPNNINSISNCVFDGCSNLGDVTIEEGESTLSLGSNDSSPLFSSCKLDEVYIGRKLSYSYSPFYRNTSLRSVTITNAETKIYDNEFYGCSNLQEFACGNGITTIGQRAFSGCSALKTYSSGSKVESIGAEAFSDCTALTSFTSYAAVPPSCGTQALDDINKWECTLHVPSESIDDYQAAAQWKEFFYIDEASGIEDIAVDNSQATVKIESDGFYLEGTAPVHVSVFSIDGKTCLSSVVAPHQTITLPTGLYILKLGNKTMKIKI